MHEEKEAIAVGRDGKMRCRECMDQGKGMKREEMIRESVREVLQECFTEFRINLDAVLEVRKEQIRNCLRVKEKVKRFFEMRKVDALNLERKFKERICNSKSLMKMIRKDLMPHNYRAILRQKMAQNIMRQPQMLQSLSSIQQQLSIEKPAQCESFETLPDYFGPASRPGCIPPPSLYQQHVYRQELEYHKVQNIVPFPPPQLKAIKCAEGADKPLSPFDSFKFNSDCECPFKQFGTVVSLITNSIFNKYLY